MTTTNTTIGEYVGRSRPTTASGTYTGVPATTHGAYVSGVRANSDTGQYVQSAPRPLRGRTNSVRLSGSLLPRH